MKQMNNDLHSNVKAVVVLASQNLGTTSKPGSAIDRQGYGGVEFLINHGTIAVSGTTVAVTVMEGDTATGTFTSAADGDLIGTEADAGIAAEARVPGSTSAVVKKIGYKGSKRFVKLKMKASASSTGSALAVLFNPEIAPVA